MSKIVRVDRSIKLVYRYREFMDVPVFPELEALGPAEYGLSEIRLDLRAEQKGYGFVVGDQILETLKTTDSLKRCLGLHDALGIIKKGPRVFRKFFEYKAIYCWKSVVRSCDSRLFVPCFCIGNIDVVVDWTWLGHEWRSDCPAALFEDNLFDFRL